MATALFCVGLCRGEAKVVWCRKHEDFGGEVRFLPFRKAAGINHLASDWPTTLFTYNLFFSLYIHFQRSVNLLHILIQIMKNITATPSYANQSPLTEQ